jgi:hypothetical protein
MSQGKVVLGIALGVSLLLPLAGCTTIRRDVARMCKAHGGTYNKDTQQCAYTTSTRSAREICQAEGGYYDPAAQYCEIGRD